MEIMLPFYGRHDHFRVAVESVLAQTDEDWVLTIIDDSNPDTAPGIWASELRDDRVRYLRHEKNEGINATFQECVARSQADWVTIFGCDDILGRRYIERMRELIEQHPEVRMVHPGVSVIDENGARAASLVDWAKALYSPRGPRPVMLSGEDLAVSLTRANWMNFPAIAWHGPTIREIGFTPGYQVVQDLALALDVCRGGGALLLDGDEVFEYRRHSGSVSSWRAVDGSRFIEERDFFLDLFSDFRARGWDRAARIARVHLSSRLNALSRLPGAARQRDGDALRVLGSHILRF